MTRQLLVGPFNRVEGDLEVRLDIDGGVVRAAHVNAPLFRGFEAMLTGKDARDALTIVPRICGICSISQSAAAARALADAQGVTPTLQGQLATALVHAVENLCDHLTHFYLFFMPDFARPAYAGLDWHHTVADRFTAQAGSGARAATQARAQVLHIVGLLAGKWPHTLAIQPGGVTRAPGASDLVRLRALLRSFRGFLEREVFGAPLQAFSELDSATALLGWTRGDAGLFLRVAADLGLNALGPGSGRYLSFGAYPVAQDHGFAPGIWDGGLRPLDTSAITEDLTHAWMLGEPAHPARGDTRPDEDMAAPGYTWCKAPRLAGRTYETGALARQVIDGHPLARDLAGGGILARVAGRLLEIARTIPLMEHWLDAMTPDDAYMSADPARGDGAGAGLVEAARGALGHWVTLEKGRIARYQIIAPTTWNFSPRDAAGVPGPLEAALVGAPVTEDEETPLSVQHIVRSFDPCMVCTVH